MNTLTYLKNNSTIPRYCCACLLCAFATVKALRSCSAAGRVLSRVHDSGRQPADSTRVGIDNTAVGANALTPILLAVITWRLVLGCLQSNTTGNITWPLGRRRSEKQRQLQPGHWFWALFMNTTGSASHRNWRCGAQEQHHRSENTAIGADALRENTTG